VLPSPQVSNDPEVLATLCLHPWARTHLALGKPRHLVFIRDPTCQEARLVMLTLAVW